MVRELCELEGHGGKPLDVLLGIWVFPNDFRWMMVESFGG
jgi:hypothetical protein